MRLRRVLLVALATLASCGESSANSGHEETTPNRDSLLLEAQILEDRSQLVSEWDRSTSTARLVHDRRDEADTTLVAASITIGRFALSDSGAYLAVASADVSPGDDGVGPGNAAWTLSVLRRVAGQFELLTRASIGVAVEAGMAVSDDGHDVYVAVADEGSSRSMVAHLDPVTGALTPLEAGVTAGLSEFIATLSLVGSDGTLLAGGDPSGECAVVEIDRGDWNARCAVKSADVFRVHERFGVYLGQCDGVDYFAAMVEPVAHDFSVKAVGADAGTRELTRAKGLRPRIACKPLVVSAVGEDLHAVEVTQVE